METDHKITCSRKDIEKIEKIARCRTAGIWRIKRAKIILGTLERKTVDKIVLDVRVPPRSSRRCTTRLFRLGEAEASLLRSLERGENSTERLTISLQKIGCLQSNISIPDSISHLIVVSLHLKLKGHFDEHWLSEMSQDRNFLR